jgi:hypothetical protein
VSGADDTKGLRSVVVLEAVLEVVTVVVVFETEEVAGLKAIRKKN